MHFHQLRPWVLPMLHLSGLRLHVSGTDFTFFISLSAALSMYSFAHCTPAILGVSLSPQNIEIHLRDVAVKPDVPSPDTWATLPCRWAARSIFHSYVYHVSITTKTPSRLPPSTCGSSSVFRQSTPTIMLKLSRSRSYLLRFSSDRSGESDDFLLWMQRHPSTLHPPTCRASREVL